MVKFGLFPTRRLFRQGLLGSLLLSAAACSTDSHHALFPIELVAKVQREASWSQQQADLEKLLKEEPTLRVYVEDLLAVVKAEVAEESMAWDQASQLWLRALKLDSGAVGKVSLQRWVAVQAKADPASGTSPEALARILLAATNEGEDSAFLKKQALTTKKALTRKFQGFLGPKADAFTPPAPLPSPENYNRSDAVFWEARAQAVCGKSLDNKWLMWVSGLSEAQRIYWNGLLANCEGEPNKASVFFKQAVAELSAEAADRARAVRAAELQIQTLKAIGDRKGAADAYQNQSQLLKSSDLPLDLLKWSAFEKQKRLIESLYWVARNRAMLGDYERAKIAAHEGLDGIPLLQSLNQDAKDTQAAIDLKSDGMHILSSRVAYEQLDFTTALSFNKLALETPEISTEWRQRLEWSEGWYQYRKGDKVEAIKAWDVFLREKLEDSLRIKALYWQGRAHWELNQKSSADAAFEELQRISPLSFYSVVAVPQIDPERKWSDPFKRVKASKLSKLANFAWGAYGQDAEAIRRFHRLEAAVGAKLTAYYTGLGQELFDQINAKPKLMAEVEPSLYASRLFEMAQQHILAISLSSDLSQRHAGLWEDYPEQLLIFFPRPYRSEVARYAQSNFIEAPLIWGIARQESSFRPEVTSPVGAIGLMQLMPATAQELARSQGISTKDMRERLRQPELNIQLGSLYLAKLGKRYQNKWPRAIAAYNAGEYVVDTWMLRRDAPDLTVWAEGLSFGETSSYVKNVWRNLEVYRWLGAAE